MNTFFFEKLNQRIVAAALVALMLFFLVSCSGQGKDPYERFPIGAQPAYGVRTTDISTISPILEETAGSGFIDNNYDTFIEGEVGICNSSYEIPEHLLKTLLDTMDEYKFVTGFYVIDLETRMSIGLHVDKYFSAASTAKTGYALYLAKALSEGKFKLNDVLEYREEHFCEGSGSTQYSEYGTLFTLKALFYRMLYNSDNIAYYMLSDYTGVDGVNELYASLDIEARLSRRDRWCEFSPRDLAKLWMEIYNFKDTCEEGKLLWKYLTTNLFNEFNEAMPEYKDNGSAHKSGWNWYGYHESGIVRGKRDYICVVMTETGNKNNCLHRTIRNLDNIMNDYDQWLKNQEA